MTTPTYPSFGEVILDDIAEFDGKIVLFIDARGSMDSGARRVNKLSKRALTRLIESKQFEDMKTGDAVNLCYPAGLKSSAVLIIKLPRRPDVDEARSAGAKIAKMTDKSDILVIAGNSTKAADISLGIALKDYSFDKHKSDKDDEQARSVRFMVGKPDEVKSAADPMMAVAEGMFMTRDLVNEPANILTTEDFAARLSEMKKLGLKVKVLEEAAMNKLGMSALLGVGQGSPSPSKIVIMEWNGGGKEAPFALVGKGVVFDTGGISLKPAGGMEDMTMDMGGAGVVSGVMKTLALRKAKANVVGLVGLVENMPDGMAQRPGDVVTSMKGTTIEVINTDAEGRLVLADVLWYAQETYNPVGMINLATLTGAIIVGLGHENAGVFSNNDILCNQFLKSARFEGEGAWRMPMSDAYDKLLKSRVADIKNSTGRPAGSITAAQFLQRFVKEETPWIHLDIAGVASLKTETTLAPAGATGWGVRTLDRLIRDYYEGSED